MDTQAFLNKFKSALTGNYQGEVPSINSMLTGDIFFNRPARARITN